MHGQEKFEKQVSKYPHPTKPFFERPHLTRRHFFQLAAAGVTASFLPGRLSAGSLISISGSVTTRNTAKNVIFVLLEGAPSHTDTFDLKMVPGVTPASFKPATINGLLWPTGTMPKLGALLD